MSGMKLREHTLSVGIDGEAWLTADSVQAVFDALECAGHQVCAVGGSVRNAVLRRVLGARSMLHPALQRETDVDLACTARPEAARAVLHDFGFKVIPTGIAHGTLTVVLGDRVLELTTLRQDVVTDGRHAEVVFGQDWLADAARRDFTMNSLYADRDGRVFDPFGGFDDLVNGRVRFIGDPDKRIREDYLRILRFFRFHAEYGSGRADAAGAGAAVRARAGLRRLSRERVHHELARLLAAHRACCVVEEMCSLGLLVDLLGSAPNPTLFARLAEQVAAVGLEGSFPLFLAALAIHAVDDVERLAARLALSRQERERLLQYATAVVELVDRRGQAPDTRCARTWLYRYDDAFADQVLFAWAYSKAPIDHPDWRRALALPSDWPRPVFPISGRDLISLGMQPGAEIGVVLAELESYWIATNFEASREVLLAKARGAIDARN